MIMTLICIKCGKKKRINFFVKDSKKKEGYRPICKDCRNIYLKDWNKKNKQEIIERNKRYSKKYPERIKQQAKNYYKKNRKKIRKKAKIKIKDNKEGYLKYRRDWYKKNRAKWNQK